MLAGKVADLLLRVLSVRGLVLLRSSSLLLLGSTWLRLVVVGFVFLS